MAWNPFKIFSKKNKEQAVIDEKTQTEIENFTKKSKDLLALAEITEIEDKYSKKSIDALKEQINAVRTTGKELHRSLKASTDLLFNMAQEQADLRTEVNALKRENRTLFLQYSKGEISLEDMENGRKDNNERITSKEKKINDNNAKIKDFSKGEKVKELSENIKNHLTEFKKEVSKLEAQVNSIEQGQVRESPAQTSRPVGPMAQKLGEALKEFEEQRKGKGIVNQSTVRLRPVRPAPESPKDIKGYLQTLANDVETHGIYKGTKEYLLKAADILKDDFKLIDNNKSRQIKETLNNSNLTKEEFVQTTNILINRIDSDLKSRIAKEQPVVGNKTQGLQDERNRNKTEQVTSL